MSKKKCPICGTEMKIDTSAVCTSIPPKYRCVCPSCNYLDFIKTSEYDRHNEEPSLPSDLDEAADAHIRRVADAGRDWTTQDIAEAFKAGAEWVAGQGVNADFWVCKLMGRAWLTPIDEKRFMQDVFGNFAVGDKVIVQIRKKQ